MSAHLNGTGVSLVSGWGTNTWLYNGQYGIPGYLLSTDGVPGGLRATYYSDTNFTHAVFTRQETPNLDWGIYPPVGLPSNNFSVVWEGTLTVPVDRDVQGWIGVGVNANTTARLLVDGALVADSPLTLSGNIIGNIEQLSYDSTNGTGPPPGASAFRFVKGATHAIRVEFQAWNYVQKFENVNSLNAQIELFWNLVDTADPVGQVRFFRFPPPPLNAGAKALMYVWRMRRPSTSRKLRTSLSSPSAPIGTAMRRARTVRLSICPRTKVSTPRLSARRV
jgi:hypothetical protein